MPLSDGSVLGPFVPPLNDEFTEWQAAVSLDGQWLAYASNEFGRSEVYVRPFPEVASARTLVSTDGGSLPAWSGDGNELFYIGPDGMTVVSVETQPTFAPGTPRVLFDVSAFVEGGLGVPPFDVSADGQRFLMLRPESDGGGPRQEIVVVQNWLQELARLVPVP